VRVRVRVGTSTLCRSVQRCGRDPSWPLCQSPVSVLSPRLLNALIQGTLAGKATETGASGATQLTRPLQPRVPPKSQAPLGGLNLAGGRRQGPTARTTHGPFQSLASHCNPPLHPLIRWMVQGLTGGAALCSHNPWPISKLGLTLQSAASTLNQVNERCRGPRAALSTARTTHGPFPFQILASHCNPPLHPPTRWTTIGACGQCCPPHAAHPPSSSPARHGCRHSRWSSVKHDGADGIITAITSLSQAFGRHHHIYRM